MLSIRLKLKSSLLIDKNSKDFRHKSLMPNFLIPDLQKFVYGFELISIHLQNANSRLKCITRSKPLLALDL